MGERLGRYRLCVELARGGMASVYLASVEGRAGLHRYVALKCIRPELSRDRRFVEMFYDEARIASLLHHANVCSVIDFDEHRGIHYLAMEFLRGETLKAVQRALARSGRNEPRREAGLVARMIADAAEGLHAAHELRSATGEPLNVVHRDVSPENVFVTYDGNVKIVDFGVARASHQRHKTRTGVLKGKYSYIQPEVLQGKEPDRRSDIWGLGVIAWELLTRKALFTGDNEVQTLQAVSTKEIPRPSSVREGLPPELDEIVLEALDRDPDGRYPTARELGRALTGFLADQRLRAGLAEVSEFMKDLFPGGLACKSQLFEVAEQFDEAPTAIRGDHGQTVPVDEASCESSEVPIHDTFLVSSGGALRPPLAASTTTDRRFRWLPWDRPRVRAAVSLCAVALAVLVFGVAWSFGTNADAGQAEAAEPAPPPSEAAAGETGAPLCEGGDPEGDYVLQVSPVRTEASGSALLRVQMVPAPRED